MLATSLNSPTSNADLFVFYIASSNAQNISFKGNIKSVSFRSGGTGLKNIYIDFYQADNSRSTLAFLSDGENAIGFYDGSTNIWKFTVK